MHDPDEHRAFVAARQRRRASVFQDLYPHDPDLSEMQIVRDERPALAWSPDIRTFAMAHWEALVSNKQQQAEERRDALRADEWVRRFPSVVAAAQAAWQYDQWRQFVLCKPHELETPAKRSEEHTSELQALMSN